MSSQPSSSAAGRGGVGVTRARRDHRARSHDRRSSRAPARSHSSDAPPLRLAGAADADSERLSPAAPVSSAGPAGERIAGPADPRWVLAVRVAEQLEGTLLSPEKRQRLVRTGRVMGLTPFDCNLVIAIVQDQARRGHAAGHCPAAGEAQLAMVPAPRPMSLFEPLRRRPMLVAGTLVVTVLLIELVLLRWFF